MGLSFGGRGGGIRRVGNRWEIGMVDLGIWRYKMLYGYQLSIFMYMGHVRVKHEKYEWYNEYIHQIYMGHVRVLYERYQWYNKYKIYTRNANPETNFLVHSKISAIWQQ